jgi:4-hydroxy-tetrahydrodipicolinate reductase
MEEGGFIMIKAIVVGACGRMGKLLVNGIAQADDLELVGAIEASGVSDLGKDAGEIAGAGILGVEVVDDSRLSEVMEKGDVVISFITSTAAALEHLRAAADNGKPMVIGTTGFTDEQLETVKELTAGIPCVMAPNMSVGINVLLKVVRDVASVLGSDYDVEVIETHHHFKKDAPSGTADRIARVIADALDRDLNADGIYGRHGFVGARTQKEIGIHAVRAGDIIGDHIVLFGGVGERLEITHRAQSREPYVNGALKAARWVVSAPKGLHDISEVLGL